MPAEKSVDVAIIGGGVTGAALLYVLSQYTNIERILLLEKEPGIATLNSHRNGNSQTLHFGDIETNYSRDKAATVKKAAELVAAYVERRPAEKLFRKTHKMVIAIGGKEVQELEARFESLRSLFPKLKRLSRDEIAVLEPKVVEGRDPQEPILALASEDGYAIDFQKLSESFINNAINNGKDIQVLLDTKVLSVEKTEAGYLVKTDGLFIKAKTVVVAAGPQSLLFAKALGIGKEFSILPVAGNYYRADNLLNGKVYTVQSPEIPFAAIHGDPEMQNPKETRFGPTARALLLLERGRYRTFPEFLKSFSIASLICLVKITFRKTIFKFIVKNALFEVPVIGKWLFLQSARKIVPALKYRDIAFGRGLGGLRPQLINNRTHKLELGEAKIVSDGIIFNITPSPGASVCLKNAEDDAKRVVQFLGGRYQFQEQKFQVDFHRDQDY